MLELPMSSAHTTNKAFTSSLTACNRQVAVSPVSSDVLASAQGLMELNKIPKAMQRLVHCILAETSMVQFWSRLYTLQEQP